MTPKIATCCYCGTRAALNLQGETRHELACSNCGAPLHEMKMLRAYKKVDRGPAQPSPLRQKISKHDPRNRKKKKKSKSFSRRFMEDVFDAAEDMLDLFD